MKYILWSLSLLFAITAAWGQDFKYETDVLTLDTSALSVSMPLTTVSPGQILTWNPPYPTDDSKPDVNAKKIEYRYILVYREWVGGGNSNIFYLGSTNSRPAPAHWENRLVGFDTRADMFAWLNDGPNGWGAPKNQRNAKLEEHEIVAIYDLDRMERIKLKFKTKDQKIEAKREVVTDEKKWTDTWWEDGK